MKPPKNLLPQGDDNGRKAAGRGFGGDSFRNYMAHKIELQRKQFGLELPPDPRERDDKEKVPPDPRDRADREEPTRTDETRRVRFTNDVEIFEFRSEQPPRKKRKRNATSQKRGPLTVLERLQQKHEKEKKRTKSGSLRKRALRKSMTEVLETEPQTETGDDCPATGLENGTVQRNNATPSKQRRDLFFHGVTVLVNGYTEPDATSIQRMIQRHGGDLEKYETSRVTHIIAEHLSTAKANMYKRQRRPTPVVRPQWIVDSVESFRLLPYADYLLDEVRAEDVGRKTVKSFFASPQQNHDRDTAHADMNCDSGAKVHPPRHEQDLLKNATGNKHTSNTGVLSTDGTAFSETLVQLDDMKVPAARECEDKASATRNIVSEMKTDNLVPHNDDETKKGICSPTKADNVAFVGNVRTTGTDPNFLDSYFSSSRLSFIGSFKQRSKQSPTKKNSKGTKKPNASRRFVFHVDMDCFFASVVLRNFPEHRNKPVVISHCSGDVKHASKRSTSECATCNYEARKYGIKKGCFLGRARELCPSLVVLSYDFEGYEEVSEDVLSILHRHSELYNGGVEQVSCDEAYMEMFVPLDDGGRSPSAVAGDIAETIREEIFAATQCTASIGVAENKLLARLATNRVKPDKSLVVENIDEILAPLSLRDLPGIGWKKAQQLKNEGWETVKDVWSLGDQAETELNAVLGTATGRKISLFCKGVDDTPVKLATRKSIGAECNYGVRFDGPYGVDHMISGLAKEVQKRMEHVDVRGSRLTLKVKQRKKGAKPPPKFLGHGSCHNHSKSSNVEVTNDWRVLSRIGMVLFEEMGTPKDDVRGMGLVVSRLDNVESTAVASDTRGCMTNFLRSVKKHTQKSSDTYKARSQSHQYKNGVEDGAVDTTQEDCQTVPIAGLRMVASPNPNQIDAGGVEDTREEVVSESDGGASLAHTDDIIMLDHLSNSPAAQDHQVSSLVEEMRKENESEYFVEEPGRDGSVSSDDEVALPPLSQIHMSQVMALPSRLRNQVISKMQSSPQHEPSCSNPEAKSNTNDMREMRSPERFRQVSVKRMMKLAAVKNGEDTLSDSLGGESVSLTQLESLPLEVQLQVANNDDFHIGVLSPSKRRGRVPVATHHVAMEDIVDKEEESSTREPETLPEDESTVAASEEIKVAHKVSCSFYEEHILPLREWMDAHPNPSIDGVGLMKDFLAVVVSENRIGDAIRMLRSIRDRNDEWSTPLIYNEQLLKIVVEEYRQAPFGGILDTKWLRLS